MLYCVKVYEHPCDYPVEAGSPSAAEAQVIAANWAGSYEDIAEVEVARRCQCGADNKLDETACDDCGAPL
jgi:hypothetical protein